MKQYNYKEDASGYDAQAREYSSFAHDILFGLSFEYVKAGENLLDIGIGTGLSSQNYSKAGLNIYGADSSEEMLNACRLKSFTQDLRLLDISKGNFPYSSDFFNHIVCSGVFHFFQNLAEIFTETARILKSNGTFTFTYAHDDNADNFSEQMTSWGVPIWKHSPSYIQDLLQTNNMTLIKEQRLTMKGADKITYSMEFSAIVAQLK